jgi:hypothetical protein
MTVADKVIQVPMRAAVLIVDAGAVGPAAAAAPCFVPFAASLSSSDMPESAKTPGNVNLKALSYAWQMQLAWVQLAAVPCQSEDDAR